MAACCSHASSSLPLLLLHEASSTLMLTAALEDQCSGVMKDELCSTCVFRFAQLLPPLLLLSAQRKARVLYHNDVASECAT